MIFDSTTRQINNDALAWRKAAWQLGLHRSIRWCGIPIIQTPEDIVLLHEVVWKIKPNVLIETGTLYGGSAVFYLSLLMLIPSLRAKIITVDINHSYPVLQNLKRYPQIHAVTGDSTDQKTIEAVKKIALSGVIPNHRVLVVLDSNHTKKHVLKELKVYCEFVTPGSYIVVLDTGFKDLYNAPDGKMEWKDDNPAAAVRDFLKEHREFQVDDHYDRFKVGYSEGGFLKRAA